MCEYVGAEIPSKWKQFGRFVEVRPGDLEDIQADESQWLRECFTQVFGNWHNGLTSAYTWVKVAEALESNDVDAKWLLTKLYMKLAKAKAGTFRNLIANWCYSVNIRVYFFSVSYLMFSICITVCTKSEH